MELQDYKHRVNDKRYIEVEIECEYCHQLYWAKWSKINKGLAKFCSRKCSSFYRADSLPEFTKENPNRYFNGDIWCVYWYDNGKRRNSTLAKWLWEQDGRTIPSKHVVYYKDGDAKNCVLENLTLMSRTEFNSMLLMGHAISDETKQKIGKANIGKVRTKEALDITSIKLQEKWKNGDYDNIHVGEHHRLWKGGTREYSPEFDRKIRQTVRLRDDNRCQICNKDVSGGKSGAVHHIDGNKKHNDLDNLILLCSSCHSRIHVGSNKEDETIMVFRGKLEM